MNLLIIQARMGSTRLPGKVLMEINGKTILQNLVDRITPAKMVDKIIIATTTNPEDDAIEQFCKSKNISCSRGSEKDVLERFYLAASPYKPKNVIRITADCPLHNHAVVDFVVSQHKISGKDYFSNSNHEPEVLEDGFDTEVFSFAALETAHKEAKMESEREHVTPFIKNSGKFTCAWAHFNAAYRYKLSVDSPDDFRMAQKIFTELKDSKDFGMNEVIALLEAKPEILSLNKDSVANSGYKKSLDNDKPVK